MAAYKKNSWKGLKKGRKAKWRIRRKDLQEKKPIRYRESRPNSTP